jgi:hypothetical protein
MRPLARIAEAHLPSEQQKRTTPDEEQSLRRQESPRFDLRRYNNPVARYDHIEQCPTGTPIRGSVLDRGRLSTRCPHSHRLGADYAERVLSNPDWGTTTTEPCYEQKYIGESAIPRIGSSRTCVQTRAECNCRTAGCVHHSAGRGLNRPVGDFADEERFFILVNSDCCIVHSLIPFVCVELSPRSKDVHLQACGQLAYPILSHRSAGSTQFQTSLGRIHQASLIRPS